MTTKKHMQIQRVLWSCFSACCITVACAAGADGEDVASLFFLGAALLFLTFAFLPMEEE